MMLSRLMSSIKGRVIVLREWFGQVAILHRWKVALTFLCLTVLAVSFQYQTTYLNNAREHDLACQRAQGRADLRIVLFRLVDLRDLFPDNAQAAAYQANRTAVIDALLAPITVKDCPADIG